MTRPRPPGWRPWKRESLNSGTATAEPQFLNLLGPTVRLLLVCEAQRGPATGQGRDSWFWWQNRTHVSQALAPWLFDKDWVSLGVARPPRSHLAASSPRSGRALVWRQNGPSSAGGRRGTAHPRKTSTQDGAAWGAGPSLGSRPAALLRGACAVWWAPLHLTALWPLTWPPRTHPRVRSARGSCLCHRRARASQGLCAPPGQAHAVFTRGGTEPGPAAAEERATSHACSRSPTACRRPLPPLLLPRLGGAGFTAGAVARGCGVHRQRRGAGKS